MVLGVLFFSPPAALRLLLALAPALSAGRCVADLPEDGDLLSDLLELLEADFMGIPSPGKNDAWRACAGQAWG